MRIGIFDSGIGGLTVFAALDRALPDCDLVYFGDTARVPYGTRSPATVIRYCRRIADYLHGLGIDLLIIACNTATTHALATLQQAGRAAGISVMGVIEPGIQAALATHTTGQLAVLGTEGTIRGASYQRRLHALRPGLVVHGVTCPLLVPLAEEGWIHGPIPQQIVAHYVGSLRGRVSTVILGCTHYPLFVPVFNQVLPGVTFVDAALATATQVRNQLGPVTEHQGTRRFLVTDLTKRFEQVGALFLGERPTQVAWVDLPRATGPFAER